MIKIVDKSQCCGCTACANVCTHKAIIMQPDNLGFLYPFVNKEKCVECGLCEKVCGFDGNYNKELNFPVPKAYAVRHKDMHEVETSRSGAVFTALSDWILLQNGIIYGAGYTSHFRVVHKRAVSKTECAEFKGSKYVQSDLGTSFLHIKEDLQKGYMVLFSGTPCQTSGLRLYLTTLRIDISNLYMVDVVCHGVPSPYIWRDYLLYIEKKWGKEVIAVDFRNKSKFGWAAHKESFKFRDSIVYLQSYTYLFYQHIMFRDSCGACHFTNLQRPSDVTIADFWGWEKIVPLFNADDKGVSLALINTEKGEELFRMLSSHVTAIKTDIRDCMQPNLQHPSKIHSARRQFEDDYAKYGFVYVARKYGDMGWRYKLEVLKQKANTAKRLLLQKIEK